MAAAKNKRSRRQGLFSKAMNIGLILLGFSRAINRILVNDVQGLINEATFGLAASTGGEINLDLSAGFRMYSPAGAAIGLGGLKSYLIRKFPVRR